MGSSYCTTHKERGKKDGRGTTEGGPPVLQEFEGGGCTWERDKTVAKNRVSWRILVGALCPLSPGVKKSDDDDCKEIIDVYQSRSELKNLNRILRSRLFVWQINRL